MAKAANPTPDVTITVSREGQVEAKFKRAVRRRLRDTLEILGTEVENLGRIEVAIRTEYPHWQVAIEDNRPVRRAGGKIGWNFEVTGRIARPTGWFGEVKAFTIGYEGVSSTLTCHLPGMEGPVAVDDLSDWAVETYMVQDRAEEILGYWLRMNEM